MAGFANVAAVAFALGACSALADTLPSPADPSRIEPLDQQPVPERPPAKIVIPEVKSSITVPDAAKQLNFTLQRVTLMASLLLPKTKRQNLSALSDRDVRWQACG